jgi:hypothetical protein
MAFEEGSAIPEAGRAYQNDSFGAIAERRTAVTILSN